ncbi:hypothetical protein SAMN05877809_103409 [Rhodobacter sp. JA431]|uniref:hypothetical protein n=1 Tax=Rhodobacter sp. JA431 TaxID=570013 RepID=UPI000BDA5675|nr:hypothetical protein [Rhodobacter sp. JA431]SOC05244.1 hypothetical protein SAMN05877809_103409 [Rhodobacter sp. JA431]
MTELPVLSEDRKWWVIESLRSKTGSGEKFRAFHAAIGQSSKEALAHVQKADLAQESALMEQAIKAGQIEDEWAWEPPSCLISRMQVVSVRSEEEIAALDPDLLSMLKGHAFFMEDFEADPATAIGGGIYPA